RRDRSHMTAPSIAAAEATRTVVNVAGSIRLGASASRHRIELAAKHTMAADVSAIVRKPILCRTDPRENDAPASLGCRSRRTSDAGGKARRIVGNPRQEGRRHLGEPRQAEEVDAGQRGDTTIVPRLAARVEDRQVDPAEVE